MPDVTAAQRKMFAKMGIAMSDGSYYVRNADDLSNAIQSVGRGVTAGKSGDTIRQHIIKRAASLKLQSKIPATWNPDGSLKHMTADEYIEHFGRKGMKWGEHVFGGSKSGSGESAAPAKTPKSSADATRAAKISTKASSGTHTLSNTELKDLVTRMNLEQQYSKLNAEPEQTKKVKDGKNFVEKYNKNVETGIKAVKVTHEAVKIAKVIGPIIVAAVVLANTTKGGKTHNGHTVVPGSVVKN